MSPFCFVTLQANSDIKYSFIIMSEILKATGEIVMYQPDETIRLEVRMDEDTVWLTQAQMAELFATGRQAITKHLQNIYESSELSKEATSSILELVRQEGNRKVKRKIEFYNLDAIISVGFRVNTKRGIEFRQWATIYTQDISHQLQLDLNRHNVQYTPIEIKTFNKSHDRFVLIDDEVYHIGASLKDLGKKWFAFTLLHDTMASELLNRIEKV